MSTLSRCRGTDVAVAMIFGAFSLLMLGMLAFAGYLILTTGGKPLP